jgi:hypothetical protein
VDDGLDRVEAVQDLLALVELLARLLLLVERELDAGNFYRGKDVGVLRCGRVDLVGQRLHEHLSLCLVCLFVSGRRQK